MRVLVTGGAGFIGSHVVERSLASGLEVAVLDNFSSGSRTNVPDGVRILQADLRDREATQRLVRGFDPELVSHHAAQASVPLSMADPRLDAEVNVIGGINLLDACGGPGSRTRHLVFASTATYGEVPDGQRADESAPLEPKSPYAISKLGFERLLRVYREQRGLTATVLRYANVYGPRQAPHGESGVVAIFFDAALAARKLTIFARRQVGDAGCVRDYVYVDDVERANLHALTGKLERDVLNVGSGVATTSQQLAERVLSLTGSRSRIEHGPVRPGDLERSVLDPTRFERAVGAPTSLDVGLRETARWYGAS
jgi:UDP-glucose 4-epimerase